MPDDIPLNLVRNLKLSSVSGESPGKLSIRRLYYDPDIGKWRCDWSLYPLYRETVHFPGDDPLQSLTRTLKFADDLIAGFRDSGDDLHWQFPGDNAGLDLGTPDTENPPS